MLLLHYRKLVHVDIIQLKMYAWKYIQTTEYPELKSLYD